MNGERTFGSVLCVGEQQVKSDLFDPPFCSVLPQQPARAHSTFTSVLSEVPGAQPFAQGVCVHVDWLERPPFLILD